MASAAVSGGKSGKRRVRVVVERKVSAEEYERHKERMESIGLDPSEPVPVEEDAGFFKPDVAPSVQPTPAPRNLLASTLPTLGIGNATAASISATQKPEQAALSSLKRGQKQVSLQRRTIEEQIQAGRHERALARFTEQQQHWEDIRKSAAQKTGRSKEDLVVTRSEEYRERVEVMELLERAVPDEAKCGGNSWYHSLRGEGTRYVQIGNMFSGLHLPVKPHKENYVHEIVRKPLLTELATSRNISGKGRKTWRDDEYLQARLRRYNKRMEDLAPGRLELHDTLGLEARPIMEALPDTGSPLEPLREMESILDKAEDAPAEGSSLGGEPDVEQPEPPQAGPHLQTSSSKLQYHVRVGELSTKHVRIKSTGTAAVGFEWILSSPQCCFQESVLPDDPTQYFSCSQTRGRIAPGEETTTLFSFVSTIPGTFTTSWRLQTYPKLVEPAAELQLHGAATEADLLLERRQNLRTDLFNDQILHQVEEIVEDIVQSVKLQVPSPPDVGLQVVQERIFEEANTAQGLYYSPHAWSRFAELKIQTDELKDKFMPPELDTGPPLPAAPERRLRGRRPITKAYVPPWPPTFAMELGPPSAQQIAAELSQIPDQPEEERRAGELSKQQLQVELAREVRASKRRPLERSPLWWPAYEVITEIAMAVPDKWAAARKALDLNPLPFVPLPDGCTSPAALAQHSELLEKRTELLGDPDKEEEARSAFIQSFGHGSFGPVVGSFAAEAEEVSAITDIQEAAKLSLRDRLHPCLELHTVDTVEVGGAVVIYELDLGFLAARTPFTSHMARDSKKCTDVPVITLEPEEEEQLRQRLQGINAALEAGPLAVLVTAHIGEPMPDVMLAAAAAPTTVVSNEAASGLGDDPGLPQIQSGDRAMSSSPAPSTSVLSPVLAATILRMKSLPSLEPLLKHISDVCQETATTVEFISHESWLGDADSFAEKVRNDNDEKKVYLLENLSAFPEELGIHRTAPRRVITPPPPAATEQAPAGKPGSRGKEGKDGRKSAEPKNPPPAEPPPEKTEEEPILPDLAAVSIRALPWATREWWAERIWGADLRPEFLVQDSFCAASRQITTHSGIWLGAPQRIVGPFIERELGAFVEALSLPFGAAAEGADAEEGVVAADVGDGEEPPTPLAPLLVVLGGGGFSSPKGDKVLLQKLKLLLGLAKLVQHEKGGLLIAFGGELAIYLLSYGLGRKMGSAVPESQQSEVMASAVKETLREVLRLGATLLLPLDFVCEDDKSGLDKRSEAGSPVPAEQDAGTETHIQTFTLQCELMSMQHSPVSLGMIDGHECFAEVDAVKGTCNLCVGPPLLPHEPSDPSAQVDQEAAPVEGGIVDATSPVGHPVDGSPAAHGSAGPEEGVPQGWKLRDIGDATLQVLDKALHRSRGVLWNGALGVIEDERWQQGTRAFIASVEKRLTGEDEDEDEEEEDEDEDEDDDDGDDGKPEEEPDPEIDFEVALAIGSDSSKLLPSLMKDPSAFTFVSQSGEGLLQLLRGDPLPGLVACSEKTEAS